MKPDDVVGSHIESILPLLMNTEVGAGLPHPWLRPTHGTHYSDMLYCWDHHHMGMRFAYAGMPQYLRHLPENLLVHQAEDGFVPSYVHRQNGPFGDRITHAQPFLMQSSYLYVSRTNDRGWAKEYLPKLMRYLAYHEQHHQTSTGLFVWPVPWLSGMDNDAATSFLPRQTIASPDINGWMYLEYLAAAGLSESIGNTAAANELHAKARALRLALNEMLWDEEAGSYTSLNLRTGRRLIHFEESNIGEVGRFAFLSASNLIPLYARMASPERAGRMIDRYALSPEHFLSPHGIRSLSRSSAFYNNAIWGNPPRFEDADRLTNSNWQGPVWFPICYFAFHGLLHYGYADAAEDVRIRTLATLADSIRLKGSFFENFDGDTGSPLYASEFASWNILADCMKPEMRPGHWIMEPLFRLAVAWT